MFCQVMLPPLRLSPRARTHASERETGADRRFACTIESPMISNAAAERLLPTLLPGETWLRLRAKCDEGGHVVDMKGEVTLVADIARVSVTAENVGGMIAGRGNLADEWLVIGGHLDHLGTVRLQDLAVPRRKLGQDPSHRPLASLEEIFPSGR